MFKLIVVLVLAAVAASCNCTPEPVLAVFEENSAAVCMAPPRVAGALCATQGKT
jgi:hypothetical protein